MDFAHVPSLEHLIALSDDVGIVQHAVWDVPNRSIHPRRLLPRPA